jgi:hypothetical protein
MKLIEDYSVVVRDCNFILVKVTQKEKCMYRTKQKTGEFVNTEVIIGYYNTLSGAINACIKDIIRNDIKDIDTYTLKDCIKRIENCTLQIQNLIGKEI